MDYGIVYLWFDKKHKRYYIGCHWGNKKNYICSSSWMKKAYKKRPKDFKRRILSVVVSNRKQLLLEEYRWLSMIKDEELGKRYYNLRKHLWGHWSSDINSLLTIGEKISKHHKQDPTFGKWNIGKSPTVEVKKKISISTSIAMKQYYKENPRTEQTRKKISENSKRLQNEKKIGMHGKKHKSETIELMKINNAMNNPIHRQKVKNAKQNIKWLMLDNKKKMAVPGTDKWNTLINEGYKPLNVNV
jgi:hypothetical protein